MRRTEKKPFLIAKWLINYTLSENDREVVIGDFEEFYDEVMNESGTLKANAWYWAQVLKSIPHFICNFIYWRIVMFKNYMKIALRNIEKQKIFSVINLSGLAIGLACCILILLWVQHELSYDKFHENSDEIYKVIVDLESSAGKRVALTPSPLASSLKREIPEIVSVTRFWSRNWLVSYNDKKFTHNRVHLTDPGFFDIFTYFLIKGDPETVLVDPYSIVITENTANKYFGYKDPIGKVLKLDNQFNFTVTGVLENIPQNSHLQFDLLAPLAFLKERGRDLEGNWDSDHYHTYILLHKDASSKDVEKKVHDFLERFAGRTGEKLYLQPMNDIHFSNLPYDYLSVGNSDLSHVYIFSAIAIFILLIACINYMNLSTARSIKRAKEIGLRKVIGAGKPELVRQILGESFLFVLLAFLLAIIIVEIVLPGFNSLTGKQLEFFSYANKKLFLRFAVIIIFTGIIAGSYPALFLTSFQPVKVLKNSFSSGNYGALLRKILVVLQFSLAICLIISTIILSKQLSFIRNKNLGFDKEHVIYFPNRIEMRNKYEIIQSELLQHPNIMDVTASNLHSIYNPFVNVSNWKGSHDQEKLNIYLYDVDFNYFDMFKLQMACGRFFSREFSTDTSEAIVLNEAAVRSMQLDSPIGEYFHLQDRQYKIIGVVKDFHFQTLHNEIAPMMLRISSYFQSFYYVKISMDNNDFTNTIAFIQQIYEKFAPGHPLEYNFLDERFNNLYKTEQRMGSLFNYFTFLAIFISCLGLFGLSSYMAERRTKEIGIRKVLGSSINSIIFLLSKDFIKWIIAANVIAWPLAYYVMTEWLQNFAYRTNVGIEIFLFSGLLALFIAFTTTCFQSIKTASVNPVHTLKYE